MISHLGELFEGQSLVEKIKNKLPRLFHIAQLESQRAGKTGMEVGSLRERILTALLIYKFGEQNVDTEIPITEPGVDVKIFGQPLAIKTITGMGGIKVVWTVDAESARRFRQNYTPLCDVLLAQIIWNRKGGLFLIPLESQQRVFANLGSERFLKLPKPGTNPRGVEWSAEALRQLLQDKGTRVIEIFWGRSKVDYDPYKRWVEYWREEER